MLYYVVVRSTKSLTPGKATSKEDVFKIVIKPLSFKGKGLMKYSVGN